MDIREYLDQLNARERLLLFIASLSIGFYLFYALIYAPISNAVIRKKLILQENKQVLLWMEQVYTKHNNIKAIDVLSNEKLLTVLANNLKTSSVKDFTYQLEQTASGDIRLSFAEVPYNDFVNLLWQFCGKYALTVKLFSAHPVSSPGVVSLSVVLGQASG